MSVTLYLQIKRYALALLCLLALAQGCKKDEAPDKKPDNTGGTSLQGGTGGNYSIVVYSLYQQKIHPGTAYIKYAANKAPADTSQYDYRSNTIVEPGHGPHVHFNGLTKGTYYLHLQSGNYMADTSIVLTDSSKLSLDVTLNMK